jgi:hypothetical protein
MLPNRLDNANANGLVHARCCRGPAHICATSHLHLQMANGAPGWPTKTAQTSMVIEELVDGPETIVLQIFQMTLDTAAHATQPMVRPQLAAISSTAACNGINPEHHALQQPLTQQPICCSHIMQAQRAGSSEPPQGNPFGGSGFDHSTTFNTPKKAEPPKPQWNF